MQVQETSVETTLVMLLSKIHGKGYAELEGLAGEGHRGGTRRTGHWADTTIFQAQRFTNLCIYPRYHIIQIGMDSINGDVITDSFFNHPLYISFTVKLF